MTLSTASAFTSSPAGDNLLEIIRESGQPRRFAADVDSERSNEEHNEKTSDVSARICIARRIRPETGDDTACLLFMSVLASAICAIAPREKAGPKTGSRFAYQAHVSIAKILAWHNKGTEYRAIFDLHDDLTLIDVEAGNEKIHFFQIKGKGRGSWTAKSLSQASGSAPRTIVGKMYHNVATFSSLTEAATFLTNAPFSFKLSTGKKTTEDDLLIALSTVGPDDQNEIAKGLELDFPAPRDPNEVNLFYFELTPVPLAGYDSFLLGELAKKCPLAANAIGLHQTLVGEVVARANDSSVCLTIEDIFSRKALSRSEIEAVLDAAQHRASIHDHWSTIEDELIAAGRSIKDRVRIRTAVLNYIEKRAKRDHDITALSKSIRSAIPAVKAQISSATSYVAASSILAQQMNLPLNITPDPMALEAALLVETYDSL